MTTVAEDQQENQADSFSLEDASMPLPSLPFAVPERGVKRLLFGKNQQEKEQTSVNKFKNSC